MSKLTGKEKIFAFFTLLSLGFFCLFCVKPVQNLKTHYDINQFLPPGDPLIQKDMDVRARFGLATQQPLLVTLQLEVNDWLSLANLNVLNTAVEALQKIEGVEKVQALTSIDRMSEQGTDLKVGNFLASFQDTAESRKSILANPLLSPLLISQDAKSVLVVVSIKPQESTGSLEAIIGQIRGSLTQTIQTAKFSIGGVPAIQMQLSEHVRLELARFMGLSLLAAAVTMLLVFINIWTILLPFLAMTVSVLAVLAMMSLMGYSMTVLAITVPILVSVTVLALSIHTLLRLAEEGVKAPLVKKFANSKFELTYHTFKMLGLPNLLTAMTTAFGFATVAFTEVPLIREFGITVSIAMVISWLVTQLCLFPLALLFPIPRVRVWAHSESQWSAWIFLKPRLLSAVVLVTCCLSAFVGRNLSWSAKLFDDLPDHVEARVATENIDARLGGMVPIEVIVTLPSRSSWKDITLLKKADESIRRLRLWPEIGSLISANDFVREMGGPKRLMPASSAALSETLFFMGMSDASPLRQFLVNNDQSLRLAVRLRDISSDQVEKTTMSIKKEFGSLFPGSRIELGGMGSTIHSLNNSLSRELMMGFWSALFVISILIYLTFRSWRWTLVAILPNLVPASILIGLLAILGTPIKPGVAIVFSIALGIAFNNTVYMLERVRSLMRQNKSMVSDEIAKALRLEFNPCMISSACLLSGFGIFLLSEFSINQTFGMYMVISLFCGIVGDLIFLPAFVRAFPQLLDPKREQRIDSSKSNIKDIKNIGDNNSTLGEDVKAKKSKVISDLAAAAGIAAVLVLSPAGNADGAKDPTQILKSIQASLQVPDESANIKMIVRESDGQSKNREVSISRLSGSKFSGVKVKLLSPADVKGVAFLTKNSGSGVEQWLYSPSANKARRVISGNKSQKFLDTEFNLEDFSSSTYEKFNNRIAKEDTAGRMIVIESLAKSKDSSYSKIMTWIDTKENQVQKAEYFDIQGKALKTMVFRDYQKYGTALRAKTIEVRNLQNQRSTILQLAGLKIGKGLKQADFTVESLESDED
jgi:uncharacterized protein